MTYVRHRGLLVARFAFVVGIDLGRDAQASPVQRQILIVEKTMEGA